MGRRGALTARLAVVCAIFVFGCPFLAADETAKTHPVRPTELLVTIGRADKIVVYDSSPAIYTDGTSAPARILYTSVNRRDISELREAIVIEPPRGWFRCACYPPIEIALSRNGKELGVISVYESLTIGFSRWSGDARIADQEKLLQWFDSRGITGPRRSIEEIQAMDKAARAASERWLNAMPSSLRPLWRRLMNNSQLWLNPPAAAPAIANVLKPELEREFPDPKKRILALLSWFGSGAGPWSGYPAYEDVPPELLLRYQPSDLLAALRDASLTESEMEGAARFFSLYCYGYSFCPPEKRKLFQLLPEDVGKSLLDHVLKGADRDKANYALRAFEQK